MSFFEPFATTEAPILASWSLEWWVERRTFERNQRVRDDFTMIWAQKVIETKYGGRWVKLSPLAVLWLDFKIYQGKLGEFLYTNSELEIKWISEPRKKTIFYSWSERSIHPVDCSLNSIKFEDFSDLFYISFKYILIGIT